MTIRADLNTASVVGKLEKWARSADGVRRLQQTVDQYIKKDVRKSQYGSKIVTIGMMNDIAQELCDMINMNAGSSGLAATVMAHISSLTPIKASAGYGGSIKAGVSFRDADMSRPSIQPAMYGSIDNIVALFEFGWEAGRHTFGPWHGEWIVSRIEHEPLYFIHNAVEELESKYSDINLHIEIQYPYSG